MGGDAGTESTDGVRANSFAYELAIAKGVEHGSVRAQEATPTHAHSGEYGDGVVVDDTFSNETRYQTDSSSNST